MKRKHAQLLSVFVVALLVMAVGLTGPQFRTSQVDSSPFEATAPPRQPLTLSLPPSPTDDSKINKPRLAASYGKLPLAFEANQGQTNSRVKFVSRGQGYTIFLTSSEAVLAFRGQKIGVENPSRSSVLSAFNRPLYDRHKPLGPRDSPSVLRLKLVGAKLDTKVTGLGQLPGKSNYFIGNDPKKWRTNVPNYARVKYQNVYPGIDLVYYGNHGQLEYDWVLAPGADLKAITFSVEANLSRDKDNGNAKRLQINGHGDLVVRTDDGKVRFHKPIVYQPTDSGLGSRTSKIGIHNSKVLDGRYVLTAENHVGFQVRDYDSSQPLVIDPVLSYSTYLGGTGADVAYRVVVDSSGNAYLTGSAASTDFPTMNPMRGTYGGGLYVGDAFVTKLNADGTALVYSTYLGGSGDDAGADIAVDSSGNAYVTGCTDSNNFPMTAGVFQTAFHGGTCGSGDGGDAFVAKLNASGSALAYSTYLGGSGDDRAFGVAVDSSGNAYVTGLTDSADFPTMNPFQAALAGPRNAFVTKLNPLGTALVYSTYFGGSGYDEARRVAIDSSGNVYLTGTTSSANFPTANAAQPTFGGNNDAFVTKINAAGSAMVYSTYLGGNGDDEGFDIAVDSSDIAYVVGTTFSQNFPTVNAFQSTAPSQQEQGFVAKLNASGNAFVYSTYLGAVFGAGAYGVATDSSGDAYVIGWVQGSGFPTMNPIQSANAGTFNAFVTELNPTGSALVFSTYLGGSFGDIGHSIALDSSGNAYVTGCTSSPDFPTIPGAFQPTGFGGNCVYNGVGDAFVAEISPANASALSFAPGGANFVQVIHTTSPAQTISLRDMGTAPLTISNISLTGANSSDFTLPSNNCGAGLASAGGACNLQVSFTPTILGTETAAVTVTDSASGSPHAAILTGKGVTATVSISPTTIAFGNQLLGTTSANATITLTNIGNSQLSGLGTGMTGPDPQDFSFFPNCGPPLGPGASCTAAVQFSPTVAGARTATLFFVDNAPSGNPTTVALSGTGLASDFAVAVASGSSSTATVTAGGKASYTLTITPLGGFNQTVTLSCMGAPSLSTCTASPSSVTLDGTNTANVTVSLSTTAPALVLPRVPRVLPLLYRPAALWLFVVVVFAAWILRRKRVLEPAYLVLGLILLAVTLVACGGGGGTVTHNPGTPAGTYTLTITGTSGNLSHKTALTLTVN